MDDKLIIDLFWHRNEDAITETQKKYGKYCFSIAFNILKSDSDAEECVNDTYMNAWNSIPPTRPNALSLFLGKITRNLSLNKYYHNRAAKRTTVIEEALDEVADFISSDGDFDPVVEELVDGVWVPYTDATNRDYDGYMIYADEDGTYSVAFVISMTGAPEGGRIFRVTGK